MRISILGGGWAGIICSLKIKEKYPNLEVLVIEKSHYNERGGLLRSETIDEFVFDTGGSHIIFSKDKSVLNDMLHLIQGAVVRHSRKSFIRFNKHTIISYPLETGLYDLPVKDRAEALISFLKACMSRSPNWKPKNFKEWIYGFFGKWISNKYLVPYNEKLWKRPLDQIDVDWVHIPGRLPIPDWCDVVRSAIGLKTIGYVEQSVFYYPVKGGIQALYDSVLRKAMKLGVRIIWGEEVKEVKREGKKWIINEEYDCDLIINTIPLPNLINAIKKPEPERDIIEAANALNYNKIAVIGVALNRKAPRQHWIYVPQRDIVFHRYAWVSNYSPYNVPQNKSSIIAEITIPMSEHVKLDSLKDQVIEDLIRLGVVSWKEILFSKAWLHEYGYPVYTIGHRGNREKVISWLSEQGIKTVGRWGLWHYWNMDKVYEHILRLLIS